MNYYHTSNNPAPLLNATVSLCHSRFRTATATLKWMKTMWCTITMQVRGFRRRDGLSTTDTSHNLSLKSAAPTYNATICFPATSTQSPFLFKSTNPKGNHFRTPHISRTIEGCTNTTSRHYLASAMDLIESWSKEQNFRALLKFVLEAILNILREKLVKLKQVGSLAKSADDLVMVELCAIHGVISYPDFI